MGLLIITKRIYSQSGIIIFYSKYVINNKRGMSNIFFVLREDELLLMYKCSILKRGLSFLKSW